MLSPKFQMNTSTSCTVVLCSTAKVTALSESRKHRIKASRKVTKILGFPRHRRKLYPAMEKDWRISFTAAPASFFHGCKIPIHTGTSVPAGTGPRFLPHRARFPGQASSWGREARHPGSTVHSRFYRASHFYLLRLNIYFSGVYAFLC